MMASLIITVPVLDPDHNHTASNTPPRIALLRHNRRHAGLRRTQAIAKTCDIHIIYQTSDFPTTTYTGTRQTQRRTALMLDNIANPSVVIHTVRLHIPEEETMFRHPSGHSRAHRCPRMIWRQTTDCINRPMWSTIRILRRMNPTGRLEVSRLY